MIDMTIFYNHMKTYKQADFLVAQIFKDVRKITGKRRGYTNKAANISVNESSRELKLVSNDC